MFSISSPQLARWLGIFSTINTPTGYTFSSISNPNFLQLTLLSGPVTTTTSQPDNNQVIVLNDFQDGLGNEEFTSGSTQSIYPLREEEEEEDKELTCR